MTTGVASAGEATRPSQVGSFTIAERLPVSEAEQGKVLLRVIGSEGTPFGGQAGLATCFAAPKDEAARERVQGLLSKLSGLRHPSLVPVLEAGVAGNVVYWVHAADGGQRLPTPSRDNPMSFATLMAIVRDAAAGLSAAHEVGLSHGSLSMDSIMAATAGTYTVAGLGVMGRGPARDQRDLGSIVISLLSGRPWHEDAADGPVSPEDRVARAQRMRDWLSGCTTERVINVVLRATELDPADRYSSIGEFAEQFAEAVRQSGEDLVHGAFEAISSRNVELARLLAAKAALYNPASDGLTLLNLQLGGGSPFGATTGGAPVAPGLTLPPMAPVDARQNLLSPELTEGLPPEFVQLIAPQFEAAKPKKRVNPMIWLVIGGIGMVLLLVLAGFGTMLLSGS